MRCLMPLRCDETMMPATTPIMAPTNAPGPCATTAPSNVPTIKPNAHMMVLLVCLGSLGREWLRSHPTDGLAALLIRISALSPISTQPENAFLQGFRRRQLRRERRSGDQRDAREHSTPLAHRLALMRPAEKTAPKTTQGHRYHRHRRLFENALKTWPEHIEVARLGQPSLGKDADDLARLERLGGFLESALLHAGIFLRRSDGNGAHGAKKEIQQRNLEDPVIHDKPNGPRHASRNDDRVDKANMVADDDSASLRGNAIEALLVNAIDCMHQEPGQKPHREFRHQQINVERDQRIHQAGRQKQLRDGAAGL